MSRALKEATSQSTLPREDPVCAKRRAKEEVGTRVMASLAVL